MQRPTSPVEQRRLRLSGSFPHRQRRVVKPLSPPGEAACSIGWIPITYLLCDALLKPRYLSALQSDISEVGFLCVGVWPVVNELPGRLEPPLVVEEPLELLPVPGYYIAQVHPIQLVK